MALRDILAGEDTDARNAADAALRGRSLTGFSGKHTEADEFARHDDVFGARVDAPQAPIMGERVERPSMRIGLPEGETSAFIGDDPVFRRHRVELVQERQPFGNAEQQLAYPKRPGFRRYWFNDRPGRVRRALRAGYAHVIDEDTQQQVSRITDKVDGRGQSSYLMELPEVLYNRDMGRQAAILERKLHDIRVGLAEPENAEGRYVGKQGISIKRSGSADR